MARKKKNHKKDNLKEDNDWELQEDTLNKPGQFQVSPNTKPFAYYSPDSNEWPQIAQEETGLDNKGKDKAETQLSQTRHSISSELSAYQRNYQEDDLNDQRQLSQHASTSSLMQHPPQNWSRDGPSGGFFEGSSSIDIKGGRFSQTYGHHTHVTIHVNQPREDVDDISHQCSISESLPSSSTSNHNDTLPLPQNAQRGRIPAMSLSEQELSTSIHNIASTSAQDIQHGQFSSNARYEQGHSTSTIVYSPDNSNKIYERHLELKGRGFPLWIPEPNRALPMPYRRKGVNIGDVGIVTPSGGFSFLFNICLPPNDPINPRMLPDGFVPIHPPIEPLIDIREYTEFNPESYLASRAIEKIETDPEFRGLSFATSAAEGAVLTLPDGATAYDLANVRCFRAYAAANIESWYRYVNGPRGWEVQNGEIRLVIGCDKATSWGMAAVANLTQHKTHYLNYRSAGDGGEDNATIPLYKWEYTGLAEAKVGPQLKEIANLKRNDDSDVAVDGKYWNQCLFIRTLNLTLSDAVFAAISQELDAALIQEMQQHRNRGCFSNLTSNSPNSGTETNGVGPQLNIDQTTHTQPTSEPLGSDMESLAIDNVVKEHVTASRSPSAEISHPADVLNHLLLQKVPNGRVVITEDKDWCSVINEDDENFPNPSEIAERVMATHHIKEESGVVFLEPKEEQQSALDLHQFSSSQLLNLRGRVAGSLRRSPSSISSASSSSFGSFFTTSTSSTLLSSLSSFSLSPFQPSTTLPTLAELKPEHHGAYMMKTTKRGRPFLKDSLDLFATFIVSLQLGPHQQFFRTFPHSFSTDEAAQSLSSLKFSQSIRGPDPREPSRVVTTTTTTTFSMTRDMAKAMGQHFMDARLIENALDSSSSFFKDRGTYQLTPKGLHVVENFISKKDINTDHLESVFSSQPICTQLVHFHRRSSDDEIIVNQSMITALFRWFVGRDPNYALTANKPVDVFQKHDYYSKGIVLSNLTERPQPLIGKTPVVHKYCFSAVATLIWLCDYTSVTGREEAAEMAAQFVRFGLITLVSDKRKKNDPAIIFTVRGPAPGGISPISHEGEFRCTAKAIYKITDEGCRLAQWNNSTSGKLGILTNVSITTSAKNRSSADGFLDTNKIKKDTPTSIIPPASPPPNIFSNSNPNDRSSEESNTDYLQSIVEDPDLSLAFREFLRANFCEENLSFWLDVEDFKKKVSIAPKAMVTVPISPGNRSALDQVPVERHDESLNNTAFLIYNTYLAPSSQYELNIPYGLRDEFAKYLEEIMTDMTGKGFHGFVEPQLANSFNSTQLCAMIPMYERIQDYVFHSMVTNYVPKFLAMHNQAGDSEPTENNIHPFSDDDGPPNGPPHLSEEVGGVYTTISQRTSEREHRQKATSATANVTP